MEQFVNHTSFQSRGAVVLTRGVSVTVMTSLLDLDSADGQRPAGGRLLSLHHREAGRGAHHPPRLTLTRMASPPRGDAHVIP